MAITTRIIEDITELDQAAWTALAGAPHELPAWYQAARAYRPKARHCLACVFEDGRLRAFAPFRRQQKRVGPLQAGPVSTVARHLLNRLHP